MIELNNIEKSFGEKQVLNGISAVFKPGLVNMIIGASGTGKSVLLKCLVGTISYRFRPQLQFRQTFLIV